MSPPLGLLADVVPFSWVDGPGNRFVAFFQGCSFDCLACHNPHTIPLASVHARQVTVEALVGEVRPQAPFLSGVTVSGGEATLQADFVRAFFAALKGDPDLGRLTTFVDTNGGCAPEVWDALLPVMDGAMVDLKALDPDLHQRVAGASERAGPGLDPAAGRGRPALRGAAAAGAGGQRLPRPARPHRGVAARRRPRPAGQGDRLPAARRAGCRT